MEAGSGRGDLLPAAVIQLEPARAEVVEASEEAFVAAAARAVVSNASQQSRR